MNKCCTFLQYPGQQWFRPPCNCIWVLTKTLDCNGLNSFHILVQVSPCTLQLQDFVNLQVFQGFLRTACYWLCLSHQQHTVVFPLASSQRCSLPQNIYTCRQRMSLHSPWSLYWFHWKRNLRFEAVDLWKFFHTLNWLGSCITEGTSCTAGLPGDEDSSKLQMQKYGMDLVPSKKRQGKAVKGHAEQSSLKRTDLPVWEQPPLATSGK